MCHTLINYFKFVPLFPAKKFPRVGTITHTRPLLGFAHSSRREILLEDSNIARIIFHSKSFELCGIVTEPARDLEWARNEESQTDFSRRRNYSTTHRAEKKEKPLDDVSYANELDHADGTGLMKR